MSSGSLIVAEEIDAETIRNLYNGERLSFREVALRLGVSPWRVYRLMCHYGIERRHGSDQNYATYKAKPQFRIKADRSPEEEQLRIAGTMLYWAEGAKTGKTVDLANSDPQLIYLFVRFLRVVCGVAESRLRVLLYAYADQDIEELKRFWSQRTGVPLQQFAKPYIRSVSSDTVHKKMAFGLVHIRYNDLRLLQTILRWAKEYSQVWAGT